METLPWITAVVAISLLGIVLLSWSWLSRRSARVTAAAHRVGAVRAAGVLHRRAPRLQADARGPAAPRRPVEAAAGALLPAERSGRGALLVRAARLDQRHLRGLQRQRPGARGDRSRHRPQQFAPHPADQAVGARRLPGPLPALPGRQPAVGRPSCSCWCRAPRPARARRSPQPPTDLDEARDSLASTVATRRAQRTALWQDSSRVPGFVLRSRQPGRRLRRQRIPAPAPARPRGRGRRSHRNAQPAGRAERPRSPRPRRR